MAVIQGEQRYQLLKITLDSGKSIEATAEHPFYIKGKGWNPANSLKAGETLQLHNGTTVIIKQIETSVRVEKVYNLTVANTHNYFVGEDGVLVHNCKDTKRVGRHMSPSELEKMRKSGRVQEGDGGQPRVADPSNPNASRNAPKGDVYVEFDVPADRVLPHSKGTGRIPGPNSPDARIPGRNPANFEMPPATNIQIF